MLNKRKFFTSFTKNGDAKVMSNAGRQVAQRYAKALFELSQKEAIIDVIAQEFKQLTLALTSSEEFIKLILSPVTPIEKQIDILKIVFKKTKTTPLLEKFFLLTTRKRRLKLIKQIEQAFDKMVKQHNGIVDVEVVSISPLSEAQLLDIAAGVKKVYNKKSAIENRIDRQILGGLKITIGSIMLDGSLQGMLEELNIKTKKALATM